MIMVGPHKLNTAELNMSDLVPVTLAGLPVEALQNEF